MITWNVSDEIMESSDKIYSTLEFPNLIPYSNLTNYYHKDNSKISQDNFKLYLDSLDNLALLVEESKLLSAVAWAYILDMNDEILKHSDSQEKIALDGVVGGLLAGYVSYDSRPSLLFKNPASKVSKNRLIGPWFAGNLIDSAIVRQLSALDRLIAILFVFLNIEFEHYPNSNFIMYPSLRKKDLDKIYSNLDDETSSTLKKILEDEEVFNSKTYRDKFIHRGRVENSLDGKYFTKIKANSPELFRGLTAVEQGALPIYFHKFVLIPAVDFVGSLITSRMPAIG